MRSAQQVEEEVLLIEYEVLEMGNEVLEVEDEELRGLQVVLVYSLHDGSSSLTMSYWGCSVREFL